MQNWLFKRAELTPQRTAVEYNNTKISFQQLKESVITLARRVASTPIKDGDHVAILMSNSLETVEVIHALASLRAVAVFLNTRLSPHELAWQIQDADVKLLVYDERNEKLISNLAQFTSSSVKMISYMQLTSLVEHEVTIKDEWKLSDLHSIIYTSGTTGQPKGVMLTYGNHWWSAMGAVLNMGFTAEDRWLACLPFFHVSGLSILMRSIIYGITVVIHDTFDPSNVNRAILEERITHISVVSNMLMRMLNDLQSQEYPTTLRCMLVGGGPVPLHLLEQCRQRSIPVYQTYGMTETASQIVTLSPEDMFRKIGSAGKPLFPAQLKIVSDGTIVPNGAIGEIVIKGPNVTNGYYKKDAETKKAFLNGWFYTGDVGYLDEEGYLYVLDRRNDLIISGGENIYPAEVEAVLTSHPNVLDAGVVGVEDSYWGQVPVAFVVYQDGVKITEEDLQHYCRSHLASYKVPRRIYEVPHMPRNAANKLMRNQLREMAKHFTQQ